MTKRLTEYLVQALRKQTPEARTAAKRIAHP